MNSRAHATGRTGVTSAEKIRADSSDRRGRTRFPPACTLYRIARWMEGGGASSPGISRSSASSTAARSSSKNAGSFIRWGVRPDAPCGGARLGLFLGFGIERLRGQFAAGLLEQNFYFALGIFQMFLAVAGELHAFLKKFHGLVERKVRALQLPDDFFQARQRMLEIGLLRGIGLFRRCWIYGCHCSLSLALGAKQVARLARWSRKSRAR